MAVLMSDLNVPASRGGTNGGTVISPPFSGEKNALAFSIISMAEDMMNWLAPLVPIFSTSKAVMTVGSVLTTPGTSITPSWMKVEMLNLNQKYDEL